MASYNSRIVGEGESLAEEVISLLSMLSSPVSKHLAELGSRLHTLSKRDTNMIVTSLHYAGEACEE